MTVSGAPADFVSALDQGVDDTGAVCAGFCHLLWAVHLQNPVGLQAALLGDSDVVSTDMARWADQAAGVPTPPPDLVS